MSSTPKPSEEILNEKWDICLSNLIVKSGIGFGVGVIASVLLFKRRPGPVWFATGTGFGMGYNECERSFNPSNIPGHKILHQTPVDDSTTQSSQ